MEIKGRNVASAAILVAGKSIDCVWVPVRKRLGRLEGCVWQDSRVVSNGIDEVSSSLGLPSFISFGSGMIDLGYSVRFCNPERKATCSRR